MKYYLILVVAVVIVYLPACKKSSKSDPIPQPEPLSTIVTKQINTTLGYNQHPVLDINSDGKADYTGFSVLLIENGLPYLYLGINGDPNGLNQMMVQTNPEDVLGGKWTAPLAKSAAITPTAGDGLSWTTFPYKGYVLSVSTTASGTTYQGPWIGKQEFYLPVSFTANSKKYYGWIKLSHPAGTEQLTIVSCAYNAVAGAAFYAGQM